MQISKFIINIILLTNAFNKLLLMSYIGDCNNYIYPPPHHASLTRIDLELMAYQAGAYKTEQLKIHDGNQQSQQNHQIIFYSMLKITKCSKFTVT